MRITPPRGSASRGPVRCHGLVQVVLQCVAVAGAALGAVLYSNWLLELVLDAGLPDADAFISELAATDQRYGVWFRGTDLGAAVVLAAAAIAGGVALPAGRWSKLGWTALGVFAVATGLEATVWSLVCAPHSDPACAAREAAGAVPVGHRLHTLSSVAGVAAAIVSLTAFTATDAGQDTPRSVRRLGQLVLAALIGASLWTVVAVVLDSTGRSGEVGIAQRAQLSAVAGWLIYLAMRSTASPRRV